MTPLGFHAQILSPSGAVYIDPLWKGDTTAYGSYYKRDYRKGGDGFQCLSPNEKPLAAPIGEGGTAALTGETLRTYRLACAATGEYTAFFGGTVTAGMSAITTAVNRVTGVYETEVSVRIVLVADNNLIVYTTPPPIPTNNVVYDARSEPVNLTSVIGSVTMTSDTCSALAVEVAGLGVVCLNSSKARGVTGLSAPTAMRSGSTCCPRMGHRYGSNHCFNGTNGNCSGGIATDQPRTNRKRVSDYGLRRDL